MLTLLHSRQLPLQFRSPIAASLSCTVEPCAHRETHQDKLTAVPASLPIAKIKRPKVCQADIKSSRLPIMANTVDSRSSNPSNPSPQKNAVLDSSLSPAAAQSQSQSAVDQQGGTRRSSFNFLRRSSGKSSSEIRGSSSSSRSTSVSKMSRKQKALAQEEALRKQREASMLPRQPPRLPSHSALPQIATFGGEDARPDSIAIVSNKAGAYNTGTYTPNAFNFSRPGTDAAKVTRQQSPAVGAPAVGSSPPPSNYMDYDPYPRTESMTNRGRYSYASSQISTVNSPRRVRRRKDPTPFK